MIKFHVAILSCLNLHSPIPTECGQKFVSESEYNYHLNTHINYGHKCQVNGCGLTLTTRKRLELHCRVMHGLELPGTLER